MLLKIFQNSQENICASVSFLSTTNNVINQETLAQCFPKLLLIFAKSSIADVWLGYKYTSVSTLDLQPSYKDFIL